MVCKIDLYSIIFIVEFEKKKEKKHELFERFWQF